MNYKEAYEILQTIKMVKYPRLIKIIPDMKFANMLNDSYVGKKGELTAFTTYVFQRVNIEDKNLSKILLEISKVEMQHLEIIGCIIKQLGEKPYYMNTNKKDWTSKDICYQTDNIKEMLECNIDFEKEEINRYKKLINNTSNQSIKDMLNRIILDETSHLEIFTDYLENINKKSKN